MLSFATGSMIKKKLSTSVLLGCSILLLAGCDSKKASDEAAQTQASQTAANAAPKTINCATSAATNAINDYLRGQIQQSATNQIEQIGLQAKTSIDPSILQNSLAQLSLNIQSSNLSAQECQVSIAAAISQADMINANRMFMKAQQPNLADQANARG